MLNYLFLFYNSVDGFLALFLPGLPRTCLYGATSGALALFLFAVFSNQAKIRSLKSDTKRLRKLILDTKLHPREVIKLSRKNLTLSLNLLNVVFWPCIISSIPPIFTLLWLSAYHSYALPANGVNVTFSVTPEVPKLRIEYSDIGRDFGDGKRELAVEAGRSIRLGIEGRTAYEGIITDPPVKEVRKKHWWNFLIEDGAGYIRSEAPVETIVFDFPRKRFIEHGPIWLATWELPFSLSLFISAITTKYMFGIE